MKIEQKVTVEGDDLVIRLIEHPSGVVVAKRVHGGLGKYARAVNTPQGYIQLLIPARAGLDIKRGA